MTKILDNKIAAGLIILISAAVFRVFFLDLMEFKGDEAHFIFEVDKFYQHPYLITLGPLQSTGVHNPPLPYYSFIFLTLFSQDPQYLSFMIATLNVLALVGFYFVIRRYYGNLWAMVSSLLLSFSPWNILLSRKIWAPDLLMVFLVPLLFFIHKLFIDNDSKSIFWIVLFLSLITQLHPSGIILAGATLAVLLVFKTKINIKYGLLGLTISLIPALPFIIYQLTANPFCPDCRSLLQYQAEPKSFESEVFLRPFEFINGSSFQVEMGKDYNNFLSQYPLATWFNMLFLLEFPLAALGIIYLIKHKKRYLFLLIYIMAVPLLYFITKTAAHLYYSLILSPIMILIYALSIKSIAEIKFQPTGKYLAGGIFGLIIITNIIFELWFYQFLAQKQNIVGDYGPIYKVTKDYADSKLSKFADRPDYQLIRANLFINLFDNQMAGSENDLR